MATLSPAHSLRCRSRSSSEPGAVGCSLQDIVISTVATALARGSLCTRQLSVLPIDLLQRVIDRLVQQGEGAGCGAAKLSVQQICSSRRILHSARHDWAPASIHSVFHILEGMLTWLRTCLLVPAHNPQPPSTVHPGSHPRPGRAAAPQCSTPLPVPTNPNNHPHITALSSSFTPPLLLLPPSFPACVTVATVTVARLQMR